LRHAVREGLSGFQRAPISDHLRHRIAPRVEKLLNRHQEALNDLSRQLLQAAAATPWTDRWNDFLKLQQETLGTLQECLELVHGALGRDAELDGGLCDVADALLDDLSHRADIQWGRFTIPGPSEAIGGLSAVIRLTYADHTIWSLPLVAHEFGHFVADELRVRRRDSYHFLFQDFVQRERRMSPLEGRYLHERFADLFAVFVLGPSPMFTATVLRFDPRSAGDEYHPEDGERVYLMLETLKRMDDDAGQPYRYRAIIELVRSTWNRNAAALGTAALAESGAKAELDERIGKMYGWLKSELGGVAYQGWLRAEDVAAALGRIEPRKLQLSEDTTIGDIMNGAWLCRLRMPQYDLRQIVVAGDRALSACREWVEHELQKSD